MNRLVGNSIASVFKPHLVVMLVIFAGAAASGLFLLPGDAERVAMLERDGDNIRALELLEKRFTSGDRSQRTLYQLEQLYQHFGKLDKAKLALESLAERRPRDLALQRRLVQFYRDTQDCWAEPPDIASPFRTRLPRTDRAAASHRAICKRA